MKQLLVATLSIFLISCGSNSSNNSNQSKRDTVVIIQAPPEPTPTPQNKPAAKQTNKSNKETIQYSTDTTTANIEDIDLNKNFSGNYSVTLEIFKSDCSGFTQGDTRPETWKISLTDGIYKMQVISDTRTIKQYTGTQNNGELVLSGTHETLLGVKSKATVTLSFDGEKLSGNRVLKTVDNEGNPCILTQIVTEQ